MFALPLLLVACDKVEVGESEKTPTTVEANAPRLSGLGESCAKTADCVEGGKCIEQTCVDENAPPQPTAQPQRARAKEWAYHCGPIAYKYPSQSHCTRNYKLESKKRGAQCSPCQLIDAPF